MSRLPVPGYQNPSVDGKGRSSAESFRWQKSVSRELKAMAETLDTTPFDHGTKSSGTLTIDPLDGQYQVVTCNGPFTLAPASTTKYATVLLHITNGSSAGTITISGMTKKYPSGSLDTTNNNKFALFLYFYGPLGVDYAIQARQ